MHQRSATCASTISKGEAADGTVNWKSTTSELLISGVQHFARAWTPKLCQIHRSHVNPLENATANPRRLLRCLFPVCIFIGPREAAELPQEAFVSSHFMRLISCGQYIQLSICCLVNMLPLGKQLSCPNSASVDSTTQLRTNNDRTIDNEAMFHYTVYNKHTMILSACVCI